ncbi:MAG: flagellar motor protein MotD, partial [Methylophaga sp.]
PERMSAIGYGEFKPIADNDTEIGRQKNRRVVLVILGSQDSRRTLEVFDDDVAPQNELLLPMIDESAAPANDDSSPETTDNASSTP